MPEGPFLQLLHTGHFQANTQLFQMLDQALRQASTVTAIGYSFRDSHINHLLAQWMGTAQDRKMRVINGENFKMAELAMRLSAQEFHLEDRVEIKSCRAGEGIKLLYSESCQ